MELPTVTERIAKFFRDKENEHNAPELIARWSPAMETQVNIIKKKGVLVEGTKNTYRHTLPGGGTVDFFPIRIPQHADSVPKWYDYLLGWPLEWFAEGIGSTGWDWMGRESCWVGFDFDEIKKRTGITDEQLEAVKVAAMSLPYVEVRKSTGGKGLHLYVLIDKIPTANHTEHSQLARCILEIMSNACGFDFLRNEGKKVVDALGGNMWLWHTKMTAENEGLKLIKGAERNLGIDDLPSDWRERIKSKPKVVRVLAELPASGPLIDAARGYIERTFDMRLSDGRQMAAFRLAGHLCAFVDANDLQLFDHKQIIDLVRWWNDQNEPPLDDDMLLRQADCGINQGTPRDPKPESMLCDPLDDIFDDERLQITEAQPNVINDSEKSDTSNDYKSFPVHCLPSPIAEYVAAASESIGCDSCYVALPMLPALATALGNKRIARMKSDWTDPSVIWCAIIGRSGAAKTHAVTAGIRFLEKRQIDLLEENKEIIEQHKEAMERHGIAVKKWADECRNAKPDKPVGPMPRAPKEPVCERFLTTDPTVEGLTVILAKQSNGLLVNREELAGWIASFGEYKKNSGGDVAHYLSMWNALSIQKDRASGMLFVKRGAVSIVGGIQPKVLRKEIKEHNLLDNGLVQRLLLAWPPQPPMRWTEMSVDLQTKTAMDKIFTSLLELECPNDPLPVVPNAAAKKLWIDFFNQMQIEGESLHDDMRGWWMKLINYGARIALVLQMAKSPASVEITEDTMASSIQLIGWFKNETQRVYSMLTKSETSPDEALYLLKLAYRKGGKLTVRDLQAAHKNKYREPGVAKKALEELPECGVGRWDGKAFHLDGRWRAGAGAA